MNKNLTEFQQFIVDLLKKENRKRNPNYVATMWAEHKTGTSRAASRDRFGYTSSAYKTLRKLADDGILIKHLSGSFEEYSIK